MRWLCVFCFCLGVCLIIGAILVAAFRVGWIWHYPIDVCLLFMLLIICGAFCMTMSGAFYVIIVFGELEAQESKDRDRRKNLEAQNVEDRRKKQEHQS